MKLTRLIFRLILVFVFFISVWKTTGLIIQKTGNSTKTTISAVSHLPSFLGNPVPEVSAKHIFILDRKSGEVLFARDADVEIYPASTTKMMTAIVAYEHFSLNQKIIVSRSYPEGTDIRLAPGEKLRISDLLYAALVQSANDAAEVLAENYPGGREGFVAAMNKKAAVLSLRHTHFLNPTGLDETGHYSSAADLTRIADYLLKNAYLTGIVSTQNAVIASDDFSSYHPLSNVNELLGKVPGVTGIKTGFTDLAGESLVTLVNRDEHEVIFSIMGSDDRFGDSKQLIDWVYTSFTWLPYQ